MKLSEELKSLGAARATVGETTVVARIAPAGKLERRIVGAQGATSVTVDDPDVRDTTSLAQARKTYALDAALGADSSQADVYGKVQVGVWTDWCLSRLRAAPRGLMSPAAKTRGFCLRRRWFPGSCAA